MLLLNIMSRQSTQPDSDPVSFRVNMISTNLNRIYSQNNKLNELLQHKQQLSKLKEIAEVSSNHWKRLAVLAETVQQMYHQISHEREEIRQALNLQAEHANKTIVLSIQNTQNLINNLEVKLKAIENREKNKIKANARKQRAKALQRVQTLQYQSLDLLAKVETQYRNEANHQADEHFRGLRAQLQRKYTSCMINLGCLENLIAYFHWKEHGEEIEDVSLSDFARTNFQSLGEQLEALERKQRKIKGEVDWIRKSQKGKQAKNSKESRYQARELPTVASLGLGIEDCEQQLLGLDRICGEKSQRQGRCFSQGEIVKLVGIRDKLRSLKQKHEQYSSFYNDSF